MKEKIIGYTLILSSITYNVWHIHNTQELAKLTFITDSILSLFLSTTVVTGIIILSCWLLFKKNKGYNPNA